MHENRWLLTPTPSPGCPYPAQTEPVGAQSPLLSTSRPQWARRPGARGSGQLGAGAPPPHSPLWS